MEHPETNYVSQKVYILRPRFDASDHLSAALDVLLGEEAKHVRIYGSKETTLDPNEVHSFHYDVPVNEASRAFHANTRLVTLSGNIGTRVIRNPANGHERLRIAMQPKLGLQQHFNDLVNTIDRFAVVDENRQPLNANHYLYFDVHPEQLADYPVERTLALAAFRDTIAAEDKHDLFFVKPDTYVGHEELFWYKEGTILNYPKPTSEPEERSA